LNEIRNKKYIFTKYDGKYSEKLGIYINTIKEQELDELTTMVDLGCNIYANAKV
jgi:hypothetical protein